MRAKRVKHFRIGREIHKATYSNDYVNVNSDMYHSCSFNKDIQEFLAPLLRVEVGHITLETVFGGSV